MVHWMAYRERRPPSPSAEDILQRMRKPTPRETDRFVECKSGLLFTRSSNILFYKVEEEVLERKQFIEEMSKIGMSRKMKEEIEGEITDKLREMKLLRRDREKQIEMLEKIKNKNRSDSDNSV